MGSGGTTALVPPGKFFVLVLCLLRSYCVGCSRECQSHTYVCSFHRVVCRLVSAQNPSDSESELKIFSNPPKHLRRCKVKPHGSLVPVSSTQRFAYTPGLSTSSSSTFLQDSQGVRENSSLGKFRAEMLSALISSAFSYRAVPLA